MPYFEVTMDEPAVADRDYTTIGVDEYVADHDAAAEKFAYGLRDNGDNEVWAKGFDCWVREHGKPETEKHYEVSCDWDPYFSASEKF